MVPTILATPMMNVNGLNVLSLVVLAAALPLMKLLVSMTITACGTSPPWPANAESALGLTRSPVLVILIVNGQLPTKLVWSIFVPTPPRIKVSAAPTLTVLG